jgi:DNA-directed RNA polymerase subunit alpha|uniref:Plastid-encoded RNA polymerase subunit alpha n=1 Tax=Chlorella vulgaris TaxID=3077 RepID=A0A898NQI9_CHLVU|nr:RNA polymerase alpha subunit [Chlorella vulgaris]
MMKTHNLFVSCIESRVQDQGSLYARFHIGTFFRGQALTFGNSMRRALLSEMPGFLMTDVRIQGATHEFAVLPDVEETVLEILLNLKKTVFVPRIPKNQKFETFQGFGFLKNNGPGKVRAADIRLPETVQCVSPEVHIATLTSGAELSLRFNLQFRNFSQLEKREGTFKSKTVAQAKTEDGNVQDTTNELPTLEKNSLFFQQLQNKRNSKDQLFLDTVPMPVQKVNYVIKSLNAKNGSEYIILEIWTDGSLYPQESVEFALRNLTDLFFQFANISKKSN